MEKTIKTTGILVFLMIILSLAPIYAFETKASMGTFKQNSEITICQICADANLITYSIKNPEGNIIVQNQLFDDLGDGLFCINFSETQLTGNYEVFGISDGCTFTYATDFNIERSYSGLFEIDISQSYFIFAIVGLILLGIFLFIFGKGFSILGSVIVLASGNVLLFSDFNLVVSLIIISTGVLMIFTEKN